jgi:hypothetical protein
MALPEVGAAVADIYDRKRSAEHVDAVSYEEDGEFFQLVPDAPRASSMGTTRQVGSLLF